MHTTHALPKLHRHFFALGGAFYKESAATTLEKPELIHFNDALARALAIDVSCHKILGDICAGAQAWPGGKPIAMRYAGHQFGVFNAALGDGRGLLLGELAHHGTLYDVYLKGAGTTPYSRGGDGRAALRAVVREYLAGEALYHLGIPTTRALCVVRSQTPVQRETLETAGALLRLCKSHIRFGTFEYFSHQGDTTRLKKLVDYCIQRYHPHLRLASEPYNRWLLEIITATAQLVAKWQAYGFIHGVMNTDNMSIVGETFDFGPFGFLDDFEPAYSFNHSDYSGRYQYAKQPDIAYWNCAQLAATLRPLIPAKKIDQIVFTFPKIFSHHFLHLMRQKLGIYHKKQKDIALINQLLALLCQNSPDYTIFFRTLCTYHGTGENKNILALFADKSGIKSWLHSYDKRLNEEPCAPQHRAEKMVTVNPKYILRTYMLEKAISDVQEGNFAEIARLAKLVRRPFSEQPQNHHYATAPPAWSKNIVLSCSS